MKVLLAILLLAWGSTAQAWELSWVPGLPAVQEGFRVYRQLPNEPGFALLVTTGPAVISHSDPDRTLGACYRVTAFNVIGESAPAEGCARTPGAVTLIILR